MSLAPVQSTDSSLVEEVGCGDSRAELEAELIDLFVRLAQMVGLPKSIGQIYGVIYGSAEPLNLEEIAKKLEISKGSASQGLKFLRSTGAVDVVQVERRRSEHYTPETSLRALASGFLKEQIEPHLDHGADRLARLRKLAGDLESEDNELLRGRIGRLEAWHGRAIKLLPFALRFLGR